MANFASESYVNFSPCRNTPQKKPAATDRTYKLKIKRVGEVDFDDLCHIIGCSRGLSWVELGAPGELPLSGV
ncbi:hypothetical protein R1sor_014677 [Riccia sorocarpa]|uniref:Uncharacterized protein n=1 Tax=Riccia sorocarpa TaxID=122646 RepID=A0ABD3HA27_9MARC